MSDHPSSMQTPPEVAAFLAKSRIPRSRAVRKLEAVLRRLADGAPPLDRVREVWAFGSFARGAPQVGDVDLYMLVDEPRDPQRFALDAFYARAQPYSAQIKALGCSGSSFVSVQAHPEFDAPEPISPERLAELDGRPGQDVQPAVEPVIRHIVTEEPLAGPFVLLWARGDRLEWALERLHGIREDADAGRHERTTTVPLLDDLVPKLGLPASFLLAAQVRRGNLSCRAMLLDRSDAPEEAREGLEERYWNPRRAKPSVRAAVAAAALNWLSDHGVDLREVELVDGPVTHEPREPMVLVDFNPWMLYKAAAGDYENGLRLLQVWPSGSAGPWLAFEVTVRDRDAAHDLYRWLRSFDSSPQERGAWLLEVLSDVP